MTDAMPDATVRKRLMVAVTDPQSLRLVDGLVGYLDQCGFDVTVVCSPGGATERTGAEPIRTLRVPMRRAPSPFHDVVALFRLWRVVGREQPDIVIASTPKAGLLVTLAAWLCQVPRRIYLVRGLPLETAFGWRRTVFRLAEKCAARSATEVVCISRSLLERLVSLGITSATRAIVVGPGSSNGVDLERFTPSPELDRAALALRTRLGIPAGAPVLGFVGRLAEDKGIDVLAEVWSRLRQQHPEIHLLIAGASDARQPPAAATVAMLRADPKVHFLGHVADLRPVYRAMNVMILPTRREGFGNVLIEAAALERLVVASDVTGCRDAVRPGTSGQLISPDDVTGFAREISRYVSDLEGTAAAGRVARSWVASEFSRERVWDAWRVFLNREGTL